MAWQDEERHCPVCGAAFFPKAYNQIYDTMTCKEKVMNARAYQRKPEVRKARTLERRRAAITEQMAAVEKDAYQAGFNYATAQLQAGQKRIDVSVFDETPFAKKTRNLRNKAREAFTNGICAAVEQANIVFIVESTPAKK